MKTFIQVGTGGFGRYWCRRIIPSLSDVARPVAAVDVNEEHLENAEFAGIPAECRYTDIRKAVAEHPADFIVLVIPPMYREPYIDIAIEAGMDIVCEKPLAASIGACVRIMNKVKAAGLKLAVTMSHRMEVEKQTVERLVKSGAYGSLNYIVSRLNIVRGNYENINSPERYVIDCLIHNLDTMRAVSGSDARTVYAQCWPHREGGRFIGMSGFAMLEMQNGVRAQLEESFANGSTMDGWSDEYLRAECTDATIVADHRKVTVLSDCGFPMPSVAQVPLAQGAYWDHALIVRDFLKWVDGGTPPVTCLDDNIQCAALVFATIESMKTGRPVDVQAYLERAIQSPTDDQGEISWISEES